MSIVCKQSLKISGNSSQKKTAHKSPALKIGDINITCDETVKLLGVDIDFMLMFNMQKAVQQLNILKRIGRNLYNLSRLSIFHTVILY